MKNIILTVILFMCSIALMAQEYSATYLDSSKILFQEGEKTVSEFIVHTSKEEVIKMQNKILPYEKEMLLTFTEINKDNFNVKLIFTPKIEVHYIVKIFTLLNISDYTMNGKTTSITELPFEKIK